MRQSFADTRHRVSERTSFDDSRLFGPANFHQRMIRPICTDGSWTATFSCFSFFPCLLICRICPPNGTPGMGYLPFTSVKANLGPTETFKLTAGCPFL